MSIVRSLRFLLFALNRSISGWLRWINNPDTMVSFLLEEMEEMKGKLSGFALSFIEYDVEVTRREAGKIVVRRRPEGARVYREGEEGEGYVV